jgi:hypothetical protein
MSGITDDKLLLKNLTKTKKRNRDEAFPNYKSSSSAIIED